MLQETEWSQASAWCIQRCRKIYLTVCLWQWGWWDVLKALEHTCRVNSQPLIHCCYSAQAKCKPFHTTGLCSPYMVQSYQSAFLSLKHTFQLLFNTSTKCSQAGWKPIEFAPLHDCLVYNHSTSNYVIFLYIHVEHLEIDVVSTR